MTPLVVIERITGRWSLETTFQEMRPYLGSVVALRYDLLRFGSRSKARVDWPGKVATTLSDSITAIKRWLRVD